MAAVLEQREDTFLTPEEIANLTEKKRHSSQARVLAFMGIEYKLRPDGSIAVHRAHVNRHFGVDAAKQERRKTAPRFELVK